MLRSYENHAVFSFLLAVADALRCIICMVFLLSRFFVWCFHTNVLRYNV